MKCVNHPEAEAEVRCTVCHKPLCSECQITLQDRDYCRHCLEEKVAREESSILPWITKAACWPFCSRSYKGSAICIWG